MGSERFEDASLSELRKSLIRTKGSALQYDFLERLQDSKKFCEYLEKELRIEQGDQLPLLDRKLTEDNYKNPPRDVEQWIFERWKEVVPAEACGGALWGWLSFRHIQEGIIEAHFLAANGGNLAGGRERIGRTLKEGDAKKIDRIVRDSLRRLCGLREARGNRSVYSDCVFARAWWRGYLRNEVCERTDADPAQVAEIFRQSQGYWERLITLVVSKNSVLGDMKVRDALVWALSRCVTKKKAKEVLGEKALDQTVRLIGMRSAWQELGVFSIEELKEMMEKEFLVAA